MDDVNNLVGLDKFLNTVLVLWILYVCSGDIFVAISSCSYISGKNGNVVDLFSAYLWLKIAYYFTVLTAWIWDMTIY